MAPRALTHDDYTVGWVCALPKEQTAALAMLDETHPDLPKIRNDNNVYTLGRIGNHNIVISCLPMGMTGNNNATTVAAHMVSTFPSIKFGLMVGIGGGVPPKVRLGDVVVSKPVKEFSGVIQWDYGKAEQGGKFQRTGALNNPPTTLLAALTKLESKQAMEGSEIPSYLEDVKKKWPKLAPKYLRAESLEDVLFKSNYHHVEKKSADNSCTRDNTSENGSVDDWENYDEEHNCTYCDRSKVVKRKPPTRDMCIHYGLIASGNQVIKDAVRRNEINKMLGGNILCFEMEAAGLMNDFPCLVIRGICDYADSHKNDDWQEHAAAVAAVFAKELLSVMPAQEVNQMSAIKILTNVHENIQAISRDVDKLARRHHEHEQQAILDWLTLNDYSLQQSDLFERRQEGTGEWLLNSCEFQEWVNQTKHTMYCPGIPGAGKTIATSIVVGYLQKRFLNDTSTGISYIYCNFRRQQEQNPLDLLSSLLRLFVQGQPSLPECVRQLYEHHKPKRTRPTLEDILDILQFVITTYSRAFIIVDALDECTTSNGVRSKFMSALFHLQAKTSADLLVTSRFIPDLEDEFKRLGALILKIHASDQDLWRYLNGHRARLPSFLIESPDLEARVMSAIVTAAEGMFLLATLHLDSLEDKVTPQQVKEALRTLPKGSGAYDQAYEVAMERIHGQRKGWKDLALQALLWIACAKRPLSTLELQHALAIAENTYALNEDNLSRIGLILSVCAGLVTVDEKSDIIRLVHYTTQEYFERTWETWFPTAHIDITKNCVAYLSFHVFETGYTPTEDALMERLKSNILYNYAARYWGYHTRKSLIEGEKLILDLLQSKAKVSACSQAMIYDEHGGYSIETEMTGVHLAAYFGLQKSMLALLEELRDINPQDYSGRTPLSWAAENGHEAVVKLLLDKDADVESKDWSGKTPLSRAAENSHEAVVKLLLDKDADIESKDRYNQTPLSLAAENGHEAVVKLLLDKDANTESKDGHKQTPLSLAAEKGHEAVVKLLLDKGTDVESKDYSGRTPLSWAAENGLETVVKLLLNKNADIKSKDMSRRTPLSRAAENGHEAVVKLLLDKDANIESEDGYNQTPLSLAAENGHEAVVKLLLNKYTDVESKDYFDKTPLSRAAEKGHETVVKLLLDKDANVESEDGDYQTPLSLAAENGREAVVKVLLDKDADIESKDWYDQTPLSWAAENGHEAVVKVLLNKNADIESKNWSGKTPLSKAAESNREAVVKVLLNKDANIESKDEHNKTPLSWAAENGHEAVVKLLLDKDANVESKDKYNRTPLSWAAGKGHKAVVKLPLDKDADIKSRDGYNRTPLLWAAENGHEAVVKLIRLVEASHLSY